MNRILASLSDACRDHVDKRLMTKPIISGEVLYVHNAPLQTIIFPHDGLISLQSTLRGGNTVEQVAIGRDGIVGMEAFFGHERSHGSAVVVVSGLASWLPVHECVAMERLFPCFAAQVRDCMGKMFAHLMRSVTCASVHNAPQRIATWLLSADDRTAGTAMDLTQRNLADILGVRLATASEACHRLMEAGAIRYSRGSLSVVDHDLLRQHACECYDAGRSGDAG
jgi:CRP-like cAMP-binding protein